MGMGSFFSLSVQLPTAKFFSTPSGIESLSQTLLFMKISRWESAPEADNNILNFSFWSIMGGGSSRFTPIPLRQSSLLQVVRLKAIIHIFNSYQSLGGKVHLNTSLAIQSLRYLYSYGYGLIFQSFCTVPYGKVFTHT